MSSQTSCRLIDLSDSDVALALAKQSVFARQFRKQAAPEFLQSLLDAAKNNPTATASLAGAGIGAGIGGLTGLYGDEEKRKHWLRNTLTGAMAGGALGGGGAYAAQQWKNTGANKPTAKPGKTLPVVVPGKATPDVLQRLEELQTRTPPEAAIGTAANAIWQYPKNYPLLGTAAMLDAFSGSMRGIERGWNRNMPQITLDADALYDAAQRGKLDQFYKEVKNKQGKSSGGPKPSGPVSKLVADLKGVGGSKLTKQQLTKALIESRATGKPVNIPGIGILSGNDLENLSRVSGGRVTTGAGVLGRLFGNENDRLAFTGWDVDKNKSLANSFETARKQLSTLAGTAQEADIAEALRKLKSNDFDKLVASATNNANLSDADKRLLEAHLRRIRAGSINSSNVVTAANLWKLRPENTWLDKLRNNASIQGGKAMRWWHSGRPGAAMRMKLPYAGLLGRAGLYAGVPLAMHTGKTLWNSSGRERELKDLVRHITTPEQ